MTQEIERTCADCGEAFTVTLAADGEILSGGGYWPIELEDGSEYWECDDCLDRQGDQPAAAYNG